MNVYSPSDLEKLRPLVSVISNDLSSQLLVHSIEATMHATSNFGPTLRFAYLSTQHKFPTKKTGCWIDSDGGRAIETYVPNGILKRNWLQKHSFSIPAVVIYVVKFDISLSPSSWAKSEASLISDVSRFIAELSPRDVRVILVFLMKSTTIALGRDAIAISEQRLLDFRRFGIDSQLVQIFTETDLIAGSDALRRLTMQLKESVASHFTSVLSRLRRQEKMINLFQPQVNHLPILARIYFKSGCMYEALGNDDKASAMFNDSLRILGNMLSFYIKGKRIDQVNGKSQKDPSVQVESQVPSLRNSYCDILQIEM